MTSTHTRPNPLVRDSSVESLAPLPAPAPLTALRDALGSPGVIPSEVDALIAAVAQRPEGEEALRERTDFLLSLMTLPGDASLQTGSAGITVRTAAVEALLELGYPYALEVPPDALERARRERGRPTDVDRPRRAPSPTVASSVALLNVLAQLFMVSFVRARTLDDMTTEVLPYLLVVGTPALLGILGIGLKAARSSTWGAWAWGFRVCSGSRPSS
ncbi:hypothetical protein ACLEPN_35080 [Myxococcus sp. 1LA]